MKLCGMPPVESGKVQCHAIGGCSHPNPRGWLFEAGSLEHSRSLAIVGEWSDGTVETESLGWTSCRRFDLFTDPQRGGKLYSKGLYIRRTSGLGTKWYADRKGAISEALSLPGMSESCAYLLIYSIIDSIEDAERRGGAEARQDLKRAHAEGRLKRRKIRGQQAYKVWVEP